MAHQIPKAVVGERYERLTDLQEQISWDENKKLVGTPAEVLVSSFGGKKDNATGRVSGRARDGRLVHVAVADVPVAAGDSITSVVTYAAPHHLVADSAITDHRRWRGRSIASTPAATNPAAPLLSIGRRPE